MAPAGSTTLMDTSNKPKSPSELLAEQVTSRLLAAGYITSDQRDEVARKIGKGTAGTTDWRLWIEIAREKKARQSADGAADVSSD